jgi:hypothetical protein
VRHPERLLGAPEGMAGKAKTQVGVKGPRQTRELAHLSIFLGACRSFALPLSEEKI